MKKGESTRAERIWAETSLFAELCEKEQELLWWCLEKESSTTYNTCHLWILYVGVTYVCLCLGGLLLLVAEGRCNRHHTDIEEDIATVRNDNVFSF